MQIVIVTNEKHNRPKETFIVDNTITNESGTVYFCKDFRNDEIICIHAKDVWKVFTK